MAIILAITLLAGGEISQGQSNLASNQYYDAQEKLASIADEIRKRWASDLAFMLRFISSCDIAAHNFD